MVRFDYLFFFYRSQSENKDTFFGEKEKNFEKKNRRLLKVKFGMEIKGLIPSVVYSRLMQPHMLEF